ncbi:MAG TPA: BNR-4 repeat-containing protein, partial [Phnomibacter sp.]|nr:BNR-4 repeat-containing protein [Phnomibacter sp.]
KKYDTRTQSWHTLHENLIDGEGKQNAYWQAAVDSKGTIHLSWIWRASPNVATNHDMGYARSSDGGKSWKHYDGTDLTLPITASNAPPVVHIPQNSELINQTSMTTDAAGNPYIATYWRAAQDSMPHYKVIYNEGSGWQTLHTGLGRSPFTLAGAGTKSIPISRPQLLVWQAGNKKHIALIYRDRARGSKASVGIYSPATGKEWLVYDLADTPLGDWEPCLDPIAWKNKNILYLFAQPVIQVDGEGVMDAQESKVEVWQWMPGKLKKQ